MVRILESFIYTEAGAGVGAELGQEETKADTYGEKLRQDKKRMLTEILRRLEKMKKLTGPDALVCLVLRLKFLLSLSEEMVVLQQLVLELEREVKLVLELEKRGEDWGSELEERGALGPGPSPGELRGLWGIIKL